jgi:hypothetical protein
MLDDVRSGGLGGTRRTEPSCYRLSSVMRVWFGYEEMPQCLEYHCTRGCRVQRRSYWCCMEIVGGVGVVMRLLI